MKNLSYYAQMVEDGKIYYSGTKKVVKSNSCNIYGFALELAVCDYYGLPLTISRAKANDIIYTDDNGSKHFMEVKSNSSPIDGCIGRSSTIAYVFGVQLNKPLSKQWGYVLPLKTFMVIGKELNHIKKGTTTGGTVAVEYKTQTVWINKRQEPHGIKAYQLEDAYQQANAVSFEEWFR